MIGSRPTADVVSAYLAEAVRGHGREGSRMALGLLDNGVPSDDVITHLLAAAQRQVGDRWLINEYSVAEEHLASGVAQRALDAVANSIEPPAPHGLVIVACAEGDWHSLPAQMFAELLRSHGFAVEFLGASTPVDHVEALLARDRPDALAVSCHLPLFYAGIRRLAEAAHRHHIPVIAGGRALGTDPQRALRLGADAWASGIYDAAPILRGWQQHRPGVSPPAVTDPATEELAASATAIAMAGFDVLVTTYPAMAQYDKRQMARTREDLEFIVQFIAAARQVDDPTVLTDFLDWLRILLDARGVPSSAVDAGVTAVTPLVSRIDPQAGALAASVATRG